MMIVERSKHVLCETEAPSTLTRVNLKRHLFLPGWGQPFTLKRRFWSPKTVLFKNALQSWYRFPIYPG